MQNRKYTQTRYMKFSKKKKPKWKMEKTMPCTIRNESVLVGNDKVGDKKKRFKIHEGRRRPYILIRIIFYHNFLVVIMLKTYTGTGLWL